MGRDAQNQCAEGRDREMWRFDIPSKETTEFTVAASVNEALFFGIMSLKGKRT